MEIVRVVVWFVGPGIIAAVAGQRGRGALGDLVVALVAWPVVLGR